MDKKSKLQKKFEEKFDRIYVLNLTSRKDRRDLIEYQFQEMGLELPDTGSNYFRYYFATPFPHNDVIMNAFNQTGRGKFTKVNEYDCARNHYAIVKTCYDLGCKHCLVIEDDVLFLRDTEEIYDHLNVMPEDYDICQFGAFTVDKRIQEYTKENLFWVQHSGVGLWNCSMYALSRKGMEYYLAFMNKKFWVADGPLYKAVINPRLVNTYVSTTPIVIQADKKQMASDIRDESNDKIDYATENAYEQGIRLTDYFAIPEYDK